jgi:hypothetical protein
MTQFLIDLLASRRDTPRREHAGVGVCTGRPRSSLREEDGMYLYSTALRPRAANPAKVMDWAIRMTEKINQIGEIPSSLWTATMSPAMGTLAWTSVVPDLAIIEDTETKFAADAAYMSLIDEATTLLTGSEPADQQLMQLVHADADAAHMDVQYASTVRAMLAPGEARRGIELGVELAQQVKQITGRPTSFAVSVTGDYGGVMWVSLAETIQQVQAATEALDANEGFAETVDKKAAKVYLPGATQTISRKIA